MSLFGKQITQVIPGVAVGIGAALVTQLAVMAVSSMMRPLAKAAIRGTLHHQRCGHGSLLPGRCARGKINGQGRS
jgi:hypothetical protein